MANEQTKKRWRPRFSVRTLTILVTLVCCYFGAWEATKRRGILDLALRDYPHFNRDERVWFENEGIHLLRKGIYSSPFPFVVSKQEMGDIVGIAGSFFDDRRTYYFWFFGYLAQLPCETNDDGDVTSVRLVAH